MLLRAALLVREIDIAQAGPKYRDSDSDSIDTGIDTFGIVDQPDIAAPLHGEASRRMDCTRHHFPINNLYQRIFLLSS